MIRVRNTASLGLAAAFAAVLAAASPAAAGSIGPNQYFAGDVNGHASSPAPIGMGCFGPVTPGESGHPLAGQYAEVVPLPAATTKADVGYTGSTASAVSISLIVTNGTIVRVIPLGTVADYGTKVPIPTTLTLPCYGSAEAVFAPTPSGVGARNATLTVDFVGQP
ncbi:hypothetical protein KGA66_21950 [Actinocrinis puniceicyclus]|uniref:Uncharacterized protein n=1 Tax=Actinocrinis puniceicyclus TaxID=977794 RepID=A0A8J7WNL6_9ACTN|nr:hypothetical protein [Actinocrinis puniceicyclus]MBS2965731.1 hypothetical protein [Actinocrinis puniceicyclus]